MTTLKFNPDIIPSDEAFALISDAEMRETMPDDRVDRGLISNLVKDANCLNIAVKAVCSYQRSYTEEDKTAMWNAYHPVAMKNNMERDPTVYKNKTTRAKVSSFLGHLSDGVKRVNHRRTAGRPLGNCYGNAYEEFLATGNPMAYGLEMGGAFQLFNESTIQYVPHCFNLDLATGTYYDTTTSACSEWLNVPKVLFIITQQAQAFYNYDITRNPINQALDRNYGGYYFLTYDEKVYAMKGYNHVFRGTKTSWEKLEVVAVL